MKKNVWKVLVMSAVLVLVCASTAIGANDGSDFSYRIIDNKAKSTGMSEAPEWYTAAMDSNRALKRIYPDSVPIVQTIDGINLEAIKFDVETFGVNKELASRLSTYISTLSGQTIDSSERANIQKASESFTAIASTATFSGLEKEADYWLLKEYSNGTRVYTYTVLYLMPQSLYDQHMNDVLNKMPEAEKEIIQPLLVAATERIGTLY